MPLFCSDLIHVLLTTAVSADYDRRRIESLALITSITRDLPRKLCCSFDTSLVRYVLVFLVQE